MSKRTANSENPKDVKEVETQDQGASFEEDLQRLEEIVRALETGDIPLEKALALYEEGRGLSKRCSKKLDQAEARIEALEVKDGKIDRTKFEPE